MTRYAVFVFLVTLNTHADAQALTIHDGTKKNSTQTYYPDDTLNLVTLGIVNGKKYFFTNQEASWFEASYFCNAHGMDLVTIDTQHENELIVEQIATLGLIDHQMWISGHNIGRSSWLWVGGEFIIFTDWETGQPNQPVLDHCLYIYNGNWHDGHCEWRGDGSFEGGFICEQRVALEKGDLTTIQLQSLYPTEMLNMVTLDPTTGKQYLFANVSATWMEASYFCNAHGLDLLTIETQTENDLIITHIESLGMSKLMVYWTSAHKIGRSTWLWINGEYVIYSDWGSGQPSDPSIHHCMHIYDGDWFDMSCTWIKDSSKLSAFICESRDLPGNTTKITARETYYPTDLMNLVTLGPGDGKKYLISDQISNWFEASYFCNAHGMDLVSIESQEENEALLNHIASLELNAYIQTSGHKIGRATYLWINGEYIFFADWAPGEPSQQATENCMILLRNDWYDYPCNFTSGAFVCEERL